MTEPRSFGDALSSENHGPMHGDVTSHPEDSSDDDRTHAKRTSGAPEPDPRRAARRAEVSRMLTKATYPARRADLVRFLQDHGAPGTHIDALGALPPDVVYDDAGQVASALGEPRRVDL